MLRQAFREIDRSIHRHGRVHLLRPGVHTAGKIADVGKAMLREEMRDLQTTRAVVTDADDFGAFIQFGDARRDAAHRHRQRTRQRTGR